MHLRKIKIKMARSELMLLQNGQQSVVRQGATLRHAQMNRGGHVNHVIC